ncbi:putative transporter [Colletotrichum sidae]|uniref:Putative transporter n=1 Tax=Colletotrichum sidae TaxID=1347389 RepID=A0A4R8PES3_9PEZI|nr:putative transporter [Colletotrichum sidae]
MVLSTIDEADIELEDKPDYSKPAPVVAKPPSIQYVKAPSILEWTEEEEKAIRRKIDWHTVPLATTLYLLCFLDRSNIGNARIQGMNDDINLEGYRFNWVLSVFYIVYLFVEVPSNILLKRIGPRFYLPFLVVGFGLTSLCTAFVKSYEGLLAARAFLGLFEGGAFPGFSFFLSNFYRREELLFRIGILISSASLAGAFGGLLATGLSRIPPWGFDGTPIHGWRNIFFFEGFVTVLVGAFAPLWMPMNPATASFLSERERAIAVERLQREQKGAEDEGVTLEHVKQAVKSIHTYTCAFGFFLINITVQGVSVFMPTILKDLGWTATKAQLMTVPPYIVAAAVAVTVAYISDKTRQRGLYLAIFSLVAAVGFAILRFETAANVRYMAVFFVTAGAFPGGPGFISWAMNNSAGPSVRAVTGAYVVTIGTIGGIVATWTYTFKDAPRYLTGHTINLVGQILAVLLAIFGIVYCIHENKARAFGRRNHRLGITVKLTSCDHVAISASLDQSVQGIPRSRRTTGSEPRCGLRFASTLHPLSSVPGSLTAAANMRLLNTRTKQLREFTQPRIPYAILSHTWGPEEVSFQDLLSGRGRSLLGYAKIEGACKLALADGFDFIWIDTCCIDKTSSSELTEAINSMWNWYRDSRVCYAYLEDVPTNERLYYPLYPQGLTKSRWFTRGWTLQELIAPHQVIFLAQDWSDIGTRESLRDILGSITGIDRTFFLDGILGKYSIAQKMSWAARRVTTRIEDQAYCLLGLFGVNMPLLYGEGEMAFLRLQEEIMRRTDDQTIFAWTRPDTAFNTGFLAPSPACFGSSGRIKRSVLSEPVPPYTFTNQGIQISIQIMHEGKFQLPFAPHYEGDIKSAGGVQFTFSPVGTIAILNCVNEKGHRVGIFMDSAKESRAYYRCNHSFGLVSVPTQTVTEAKLESILIGANKLDDERSLWQRAHSSHHVVVKPLPLPNYGFDTVSVFPPDSWVTEDSGGYSTIAGYNVDTRQSDYAHIHFQNAVKKGFCLRLQADSVTIHALLDTNVDGDQRKPASGSYNFDHGTDDMNGSQDYEDGKKLTVVAKMTSSKYGRVIDVSILDAVTE